MTELKKRINEESIIEASWKLLDLEGIDNFSMRKLSNLLNIKAPSIYWHFKSKEDIFRRLTDEVIKKILDKVECNLNWEKQIFNYGMVISRVLRKYPYSAHLLLQATPVDLNFLKLHNELLKIIDNLNFSDEEKFSSVITFLNYIVSFEIDYLAQKKIQENMVKDKKYNINLDNFDETEPVNRLFKNKTIRLLGSDTMFIWGLNMFIQGLSSLNQKNQTF
ncbi:TetR/AcrR family transcriptional regulator [Clostridioides difficile]